ncbi:hypothetical protein V6N13_101610 [Hibiscus sabdariffa]|uniref:Uncharacterized protein n=1 Tax=Hibiscus sabdariffa TaxID=183260 RepID=A0ABR2QM54_9ROSI
MMVIHPELTRDSMAKPSLRNGQTEKLEPSHIPLVSESKTADNASSLLEESLQKQRMQLTSLPNSWHFNVYSETRCSGVLFTFAALHKRFPPSKLGPVTRLPP